MHFISKEAFRFKDQMRNMTKVQNIAVCGLFIALYIVLSYFKIRITDSLEIRFAFLILAVSAYYGGPVMGLIVGAASDILSMVLTAGSGSPFFFGFTLSYAVMGFLFGVVLYKSKVTIPRVIAAGFVEFLVSISLNTIWLQMMYGMPMEVLFVSRLVKCSIMLFINIVLLYVVLKSFSRVFSSVGMAASRA